MFPCLFILATETLSYLLSRAKESGFINGFLVRGKSGVGVEVSHLLFADNSLILCDASKENLEYLSSVFMWFDVCLGLKMNLGKSEMILVGNVLNLEELAKVLGCKVGAILTTYLGPPLGVPFKSSKVWRRSLRKGLLGGRGGISLKTEDRP